MSPEVDNAVPTMISPPSAPPDGAADVAKPIGPELFKQYIWIPASATVVFLGWTVTHGRAGLPHVALVLGGVLVLGAQIVAWYWASLAWRRLTDPRFIASSVLAATGASLLLWGTVNPQPTPALRTYRIGLSPQDVVFTPGLMWVSDPPADAVYRVDGSEIETIRLPGAFEVAADGNRVWVSRTEAITQLDANGSEIMSVPTPGLPGDIVVAGQFVWITLPESAQVARVDVATGELEAHPLGRRPASMAFANGAVWVTDVATNQLFELDAVSGDVLHHVPTGLAPYGVFTDGRTVWVANTDSDTVTEVDAWSGDHREFRVPAHPTDLLAHAGTLWVLSRLDHRVSAVEVSSGEVVRDVDLGGEPLKLELQDDTVFVTNSGLGALQGIPLRVETTS